MDLNKVIVTSARHDDTSAPWTPSCCSLPRKGRGLMLCFETVHCTPTFPRMFNFKSTHLFVDVLLQESKEQQEALVRWHDTESLLQPLPSGHCLAVIHTHIQRLALERYAGQVLHLQPNAKLAFAN
jgi:hypothetical protein